jgi:hypothetical protein
LGQKPVAFSAEKSGVPNKLSARYCYLNMSEKNVLQIHIFPVWVVF